MKIVSYLYHAYQKNSDSKDKAKEVGKSNLKTKKIFAYVSIHKITAKAKEFKVYARLDFIKDLQFIKVNFPDNETNIGFDIETLATDELTLMILPSNDEHLGIQYWNIVL